QRRLLARILSRSPVLRQRFSRGVTPLLKYRILDALHRPAERMSELGFGLRGWIDLSFQGRTPDRIRRRVRCRPQEQAEVLELQWCQQATHRLHARVPVGDGVET